MSNDNKTSLKAHHGQHSDKQAGKRGLLLRLTIFMAWVAGIGLLLSLLACTQASGKPIASDDTSSYYIDLSKTKSGQPSRNTLAFFVPDNSAASQAVTMPSCTASQAHTRATRGQTIISKVNTSPTDYDGLTLQNKRAERRICGAVAFSTESKTRHPIPIVLNQAYSVAHTQKLKGVIHHG